MFKTYLKYFSFYIVSAKNRQRLLILAVAGLFLSSLSLIVLQSTMGGLQNSVMNRSKDIMGTGVIYYKNESSDSDFADAFDILDEFHADYLKEYELEVLLRYETFLTPVVVHGVDTNSYLPPLLAKELMGKNKLGNKIDAVMPIDLAYKVGVAPPEELQLISPAHVDELLGEIPRGQTVRVENTTLTNVPEIDQFHMWVRLPLIHNLIQSYSLNRIRIYNNLDFKKLKKALPADMVLKTWEEENATLVWALKLENTVMVFLFAGMSLLVSLCISSGLLIFFNKIKTDLSSFWILGASYKQIESATKLFLHLMSFLAIVLGIVLGLVFLWLLHTYAPDIMPDVFVDRKIPILVTAKGIFISFIIPYVISFLFVNFSFMQFKKDHDVLDHIRSI